MKTIKEQIEAIRQETALSETHLTIISSNHVEGIIGRIQQNFCKEKGMKAREPSSWLWEKFCKPFDKWDVRGIDMEKFFDLMLPPGQLFWFLIFDQTQQPMPFWVFEADLEGVATVVWNSNINEYYIVDKSCRWLVAENHKGEVFALGQEAISRLQFAKTQVL